MDNGLKIYTTARSDDVFIRTHKDGDLHPSGGIVLWSYPPMGYPTN